MKQHLTKSDLNQLSDKAKERLREWWKPKWGDLVFDGEEIIWEEDRDGCILFDDDKKMTSPGGTEQIWTNAYPLLSIGQMIEFLDENEDSSINSLCFDKGEFEWYLYTLKSDPRESKPSIRSVELCDALFAAVKEVLEKE